MRRRDLLTIAATQQVREMQEGINYHNFKPLATMLSLDSFTIHFQLGACDIHTSDIWVVGHGAHSGVYYGYKGVAPCFYGRDTTGNVLRAYTGNPNIKGLHTLTFHKGVATWYNNGIALLSKQGYAQFQQIKLNVLSDRVRRDAVFHSLRIFNHALAAQQVTALYNNGKPEEYLLPAVDKVGCIAEYLPQNLVTAHDGDMTDKTPIAWLDSAKQIPLNDEYLPPLLQSIGGYDLEVGGVPEIIHKPRLVQCWDIDLMNESHSSPWIHFDEPFSSHTRKAGKIIITSTSIPQHWLTRPVICVGGIELKINKSYKYLMTITSIFGNANISGYYNIESDGFKYFVTEGGGRYPPMITPPNKQTAETPLMKYTNIDKVYNWLCFYTWSTTPISNSQFSIDKIIIEEYD